MRFRNILILVTILFVLGGYFYFANVPEPAEKKEPQLYVWLFEMEELQHIAIELPREGKSQAFIKEEDRSWHFDDSQRSNINMKRWGGGIPLLLSGPGIERVIAKNATDEKLAEFGFNQPQMKVTLTLEDGEVLDIMVGDSTPGGLTHYVQAPGTRDIALVNYTWFDEIARLVNDPPYALPEED